MRVIFLRRFPVWAVGIISGIYFGVVMGVLYGSQDRHWQSAAVGGRVAGAIDGTFYGFAIDKQREKARDIAGTITEGKFEAAYRASANPIPTDPEVREATARLLRYRLHRQRWLNLPVFGLFSLLGIYLALTSAPIWWLSVALFVSMPLNPLADEANPQPSSPFRHHLRVPARMTCDLAQPAGVRHKRPFSGHTKPF